MIRLFIEDNELDVAKDFNQRITYAVDDLFNLDSKATAFSQTIILPGTTRNNRLLGNIFEFNNANFTSDDSNVGYNFNAAKSAQAYITSNGLQMIKGVLRLLEIVRDGASIEYEVAVFGELGGLVSAMGNKRLQDLDFQTYNHNYTLTAIKGSWDNANSGIGLYYPLIDYGNLSTNKRDYQYRAFRPALHVREYIDKIITGAGYTWESNFFNTDFFKRLIIPQNQSNFFSEASQFFTGANSSNQQLIQNVSGSIITPAPITFTSTYLKNFSFASGVLTNTSGQPLSVSVEFFGVFRYYSVLRTITINTFINGVRTATIGTLPPTGGTTYVSNIVAGTVTVTVPAGQTLDVRASVIGDPSTTAYDVIVQQRNLYVYSTIPVVSVIQLGDFVNMADVIPKGIFQKDFFSSILKMFYLMVTEDKYKEKHLIIEPYVNFYTGEVIDWSDKLDRSKPIRIKPMSEVNARYYQLKFKQDSDFYNEEYRKKYNEGYGDRVFDNGLEFAKDTDTVDIIFSASVLTGSVGEDKVVPAIYKKSNAGAAEDSFDHNIRIMQAKKITGVTAYNILDGVTAIDTITLYGYAGHLDDPDAPAADVHFGAPKELFFNLTTGDLSANLFNAYYSAMFAEITDKDSRLITAKFRLKDSDITQLDFAKFVYLDGGLYRISKIVDFVPGQNELTDVQLLRVINTDY